MEGFLDGKNPTTKIPMNGTRERESRGRSDLE
jgi:hypothetical protein